MKHCPECGQKVKEISKFCSSCSYELKNFNEDSKEENNNLWECEYCGEEFKNETLCLRHEKNCSKIPTNKETKSIFKKEAEVEPKYEKVIVHEHHKSSYGGVIAFFIVLLVIGVIIFFVIMLANQGGFSSGGGVSRVVDPCQRAFDDCNNGCGDGWLSGACKEACAYDYRRC